MTLTAQLDSVLKSQRRGALGRHQTLTGIDYIEVRQVSPSRWDLLVHFVPAAPEVPGKQTVPLGITPDHITILGRSGTADATIQVVSVQYPEDGGSVLTITVEATTDRKAVGSATDFPTYTLALVNVSGVDRFFSSASFTFDVSAPSDFHPGPTEVEEPGFVPLTQIDYLAKDYESFRKLILDRMSVRSPQWTERNPTDLGIALVELLAYAGDYLSYYQDAVATEAYIGTARQRVSIARHARLLDYYMHQGCNARVWAQVQVAAGLTLEAGTPLLTSVGGQLPRIPTPLYEPALQQRPTVFETMHSIELFETHNQISFYTWGAAEYLLPKGTTRAALRGHFPDLKVGDVLIFEEAIGRATGSPGDADGQKRHPVRIDAPPVPGIDPLHDDAAITEIEWSDEDALPFDLQVSTYLGDAILQDISVARGNIVLADHGRTLGQEQLPPVPESGRYRLQLERNQLTQRVPYRAEETMSRGARYALLQQPQDALRHPLGCGPRCKLRLA